LPKETDDAQTPPRTSADDCRRTPSASPRQAAPVRRPLRHDAVAALVALQDEYRAWLDRLPENPEGSRTAEKLQAIAELDLDELLMIDPPRG
jgi:hypothetical protein